MPTGLRATRPAHTVTCPSLVTSFPGLRDAPPRVALTDLPTPITPATALAGELGLDTLQIKCDDQTAPIYGGNKVRKLEYLFGDALRRGCDGVVTFGAVGSNHALATAIYASKLGLSCHIVMTDQPVTPYVAKTLRYHALLGTHLEHVEGHADTFERADLLATRHPSGADRLYRIPLGGSSPLGTIGFVNAALELADQCRDEPPDALYVACGTMGTAAGLALGLRLAGLPTRIEAVRVVPAPVASPGGMAKLFAAANRKLHEADDSIPLFENPLANIRLRDEFFGAGYAQATPDCTEAVALIRATENVTLETTYTGKALAALIQDARNGQLDSRRVMFWNTYNSRLYPHALDAESGSSLPDWARDYLAGTGTTA